MQRSLKSETVESIVDDGSQNKKVNSVQWDIEKVNVDSEANQDGDNVETEPSNERLSVMRQQFAVAGSGTGSSSIEDRFCCTNMALKVYKKAWEGARKALPRATRNRLNNTSLDNSSSVDQRRAINNRDPNRTISLESEDDPATECSFEYDEDGDLRSELGDQPLRRRTKDADRPTTLRGLERLSTDTEEFGEDETNSEPEDVDLEAFKRVYMSDLVIPEEPDKESAAFQETNQLNSGLENNNNQEDSTVNSEGSKWKRRFKLNEKLDSNQDNSTEIVKQNNNTKLDEKTINENIGDQTTGSNENKQSINEPDKPMSLTDIERFVQVTCDQVMEKVRDDIMNNEDGVTMRGSGIFKIRPGIRNEDSQDSRASTEVTISTIEIPTITITEDQLDDSSVILSEATLRDETGSEGAGDELTEDGNTTRSSQKGKATALKFKVKKLGSKVKDIFKRGTTPEVSPTPSPVTEYIDIEEENRRRKEEEKEAEKKRKEEENARKEEEKRRKEEADKRRKEEEFERKYAAMVRKAELDAVKERERQKKEEAKRIKEEEERLRKEEEKARKEEEKRLKAEEEKRRKEEEKRRKEEEKRRKEEADKRKREEEFEKKYAEEVERLRLKEEEERKKLREMEEKKRKQIEEEKRRKIQLEEEEERRRKRQEEEEERRRKRQEEEEERKRRRQEEEEERKLRRQEEEEERRRKRQEEEEELKRLNEEESANLHETLKRKLEDELSTGVGKDVGDGETKNVAGDDESGVIKSEQDDPYADGYHDNNRRASSPSIGHASVTVSKSTSQATIMITSPPSIRDKRSPSRGEETFGQAGESEGDVELQMDGRKRKKMRKRFRDTKNKLINLKSKALESLPSMSTLKSRVKEILPVRSGTSGQDESNQMQGNADRRYSIHREQKIFSEYRKRYPDSENEFFSDSELVESRKSTLKALAPDCEPVPGGMYNEIETSTEDRVQLLLSPINSPLRPPRRSDYGVNSSFHASEPNISRTGTPKKPKRAPPPRPPPPEIDIYLISSNGLDVSREGSTATSLGALEDIDLNSSNRDLTTPNLVRNVSDKIPASIYYRNVVREWQERHNKRMDELISASSPNLEVYQRPPRSGRHPPRPLLHPISSNNSIPHPLPRRRLSRASLLRQKIREQQAEEAANSKENIDGYEVLEKRDIHPLTAGSSLPPLPPPRFRSDRHTPLSKSPYSTLHRLQQQKQQQNRSIQQEYLLSVDRANLATDGLYWKPFSWKTGRCRSLTELYVRKRSQPPIIIDTKPSEIGSDHSLNQEPVEKSLSYRLMSQYCSPPRPPPPTIKTEPPPEDFKDRLPDTVNEVETSEPIYSTIDRSKKLKRDLESNNVSVVNGELIKNRPLPAPPLPPRSKRKNSLSRSRSNSPYLSLAGSSVDLDRPETTLIRPVSPYPIVGMVDVSVETGSQLIDYPRSYESKECQTSLEDLTNKQPKTNLIKSNDQTLRQPKDLKESYVHLDCTGDVGYADDGRDSITPTPTTIAQVAIKVTPEREVHMDGYKNNDLNPTQLKRTRLSSSSSKESSPPMVTASSGSVNMRSKISPADDEASSKTITHYYDAEECDTDMDTFADLDSLSTEATQTLTASTQFHSVLSEPQTISSSITGATSHYDTDQASSKTMEIPTPPEDPAPQPPTAESIISGDMIDEMASSSSRTVPLVAEHVTIDEDSDDDMLQPRVASPSEMRAYMSRRRMRPDSMDASDSEW